jgi:hypothetical protein
MRTPQPILTAAPGFTIIDLLDGLPWFKGEKGREAPAPWTNWRVFLKAVYGLPMTDREASLYTRFTGRKDVPTEKFREVWGLCGRRARKTAIEALIGAWEGGVEFPRLMLSDHPPVAPGERARIPMISKNKDDAKQIKSHLMSILNCKGMRHMLAGEPTAEEVVLNTGVDFTIRAVSLTAGRTRASPCAMLDEVAFWQSDESAQPDVEVIAGIRPSMATFPNPLLVGMSSVYGKTGVVWNTYQDHYRNEGSPVLVWLASTTDMHDSEVIRKYVQAELVKDPVGAAAEFQSEFRTDIGPFVDPEVVEAAVVKGRDMLEYDARHPQIYWAFCDPSGGSQDSFGLGIAHMEGEQIIVDLAQEWPVPFEADQVMDDLASILGDYRVRYVTGDNVGGIWLRDPLKKGLFSDGHPRAGQPRNIDYVLASMPKSKIYLNILPRLNAGRLQLVDDQTLIRQIKGLERKQSRGGDIVDHRAGAKDDVANSVLGAAWLADTLGKGRKQPEAELEPATTTQELLRRERVRLLEKERRGDHTKPRGTPSGRMKTFRRRRF